MFSIEIQTDNEGTRLPENVAPLLRQIATRLEAGRVDGPIMDSNGNTVGTYAFEVIEDD